MKSIIYWHPAIYTLVMKLLYKEKFYERYRTVADLIPEGADIIDVCCGDCYIYFNFLQNKHVTYRGLDMNRTFIHAARKKGVRAEQFDLMKDRLPRSDYILMQASLYHFIPYQDLVMQKILDAALTRAIISEPIINLSSSENMLIRSISKALTRAGSHHSNERLNRETLMTLFERFRVTSVHEMNGGREIIGVFDKIKHT